MESNRILAIAFCAVLCIAIPARSQEIDKELSSLAVTLAGKVKDQGNKKIAVIDFTDLDGNGSALGKYIAEELTIDLVMEKRDFAVLDRANLRKILAEHKLTSQGLVDPENAKQLGKFAGVDAIIIGTIIPKGTSSINLNAKIIATETAEIVGAGRAEFKVDTTISELMSKPNTGNLTQTALMADKAILIKTFQDLRVDIFSLKIVNGTEYLLNMNLSNQNPKKSILVALCRNEERFGVKGHLTDPNGIQHEIDMNSLSGIELASQFVVSANDNQIFYQGHPTYPRFKPALEIKPSDSNPVTLKFRGNAKAEPGLCSLQIELLVGRDFVRGAGVVDVKNLVCKINAQ